MAINGVLRPGHVAIRVREMEEPGAGLIEGLPSPADATDQCGHAEKQQRGADDRSSDLRLNNFVCARGRTKRASTNSAVLPKLTLSKPPMAPPARSASCSVARRFQSASTPMATTLVRKTQVAGASAR